MAKRMDAETVMKLGCKDAIKIAKSNEVDLDFSDESIKKVEKMLGELHREYKKTKDETGLYGIAVMFGSYIGEVIRKKGLGGTWKRDHPDVGEDSFPFDWNGTTIFPAGWCYKRMVDGKGDDVWFKYQALVMKSIPTKQIVVTPKKRRS